MAANFAERRSSVAQLQLRVITDIDPEIERVHLRVTGVLTEANHQLLYQVSQRSRSLPGNTEVLVDLTAAERIDHTAVDFLMWELDPHETGGPLHPVGVVLPVHAVAHPGIGPAPESPIVWIG